MVLIKRPPALGLGEMMEFEVRLGQGRAMV
jgi:hypothetical protein